MIVVCFTRNQQPCQVTSSWFHFHHYSHSTSQPSMVRGTLHCALWNVQCVTLAAMQNVWHLFWGRSQVLSVFSLCDVLTELYKNSKDGQETNPLQMSDRGTCKCIGCGICLYINTWMCLEIHEAGARPVPALTTLSAANMPAMFDDVVLWRVKYSFPFSLRK